MKIKVITKDPDGKISSTGEYEFTNGASQEIIVDIAYARVTISRDANNRVSVSPKTARSDADHD